MTHEKKTDSECFEKMLAEIKNFDVRLADIPIQPGDTIIFREWDPAVRAYSGRKIEKEIACVLKTKDLTFWPEEDIEKHGLQVVGFK